jgi:lipopolysaccharide/colanic/teichoic acid biosynthesis glycosyltransferase
MIKCGPKIYGTQKYYTATIKNLIKRGPKMYDTQRIATTFKIVHCLKFTSSPNNKINSLPKKQQQIPPN